jgi:hypothetical protein
MVWRQLSARVYRSLVLVAAVAVATVGSGALAASSEHARFTVDQFVAAHARGAYDLLVRPAGTVTSWERAGALVRPGHLTGYERGLTVDQWREVAAVGGVAVAAPAGVVGQVGVELAAVFDLTGLVDPSLDQQVLRVWPTRLADAGLTARRDDEPRFAYVTRWPLAVPEYLGEENEYDPGGRPGWLAPDGTFLRQDDLVRSRCSDRNVASFVLVRTPAAGWQPVCGTQYLSYDGIPAGQVGTPDLNDATFAVFQALPDGEFLDFTGLGTARDQFDHDAPGGEPVRVRRVEVPVRVPVWLPVGVIDPVAEDRLVGLDGALLAGRPLPPGPGEVLAGGLSREVSALVASRIGIDERVEAEIDRLTGVDPVAVPPAELLAALVEAEPETPDGSATAGQEVAAIYREAALAGVVGSRLDRNIRVGAARLSAAAGGTGALTVLPVRLDREQAWFTPLSQYGERGVGSQALQPALAEDTAFRPVTGDAFPPPEQVSHPARAVVTGVFDPDRLTAFSVFSELPLQLYDSGVVARPPGQPAVELRPNTSPTGYLALPPSMLISVESAQQLTGRDDVIGAIRVRVAGATGVDPASRRRVEQVAAEIARIGGVAVDGTIGASPQQQLVRLPAGQFGRPELLLVEQWPRQGAAVGVVGAAAAKQQVLFGLIAAACLCLLANAASAAVRQRRPELAVLACLGWSRWRVLALLLAEAGGLGLVAGAAAALPLGWLLAATGATLAWWWSLLAAPIAVAVAVGAAAIPAARAARGFPGPAVHPVVARVRRRRRPLAGAWSLAWTELLRTPGRSVAAGFAVAVSVAAVATLLAVQVGFGGAVAGTRLGDAVAVRVQATDLVLLAVLVAVAVATVADVVYVGLRERRAELALLLAVGWPGPALARLVLRQAAILGVAGAAAGAAAAVATTALLGRTVPGWSLVAIGISGAALAMLATAAVTVPAMGVRALSGRVLSEEG